MKIAAWCLGIFAAFAIGLAVGHEVGSNQAREQTADLLLNGDQADDPLARASNQALRDYLVDRYKKTPR